MLVRHMEADLCARPGIFIFHPTVPNYPKAKFPGVVVFSEIYQGMLNYSSLYWDLLLTCIVIVVTTIILHS
jgi:hypothetical protein